MVRYLSRQILRWYSNASDFLHAPVDVRTVATVRIGYAALLLINVLCWWPDLDRWFSDEGVMTLANSRRIIDPKCLTLFQILPGDRLTLRIVYGLFLGQIVALLLGWKPRLQAACCFVWLVSFQHRNILIFDGEDTLFRIIGFLLIFMPLGRIWSVDSLLSPQPEPDEHPLVVDGWSVRLLQIEMTLIYFSAAWIKLLGPAWRDGTALYYVSRLDDYWGRFPIPAVLLETPWIVRSLTWSTMAAEFAVPLLIWFQPTRRIALGIAITFHLACEYAMYLFLFHWIMLNGWMSFLQTDDFQLAARILRLKTANSRT